MINPLPFNSAAVAGTTPDAKARQARCFPAQDIEIAVVRANFVKGILWAVPLVKDLLDHVLTKSGPSA